MPKVQPVLKDRPEPRASRALPVPKVQPVLKDRLVPPEQLVLRA